MPQFDVAFFASQIFWTIVSFIVLFVLLSRWVLPRIKSALQERAHLIEAEIEAACRKRTEGETLKQHYADKLSTIDAEVKKMFDESEQRIIERRDQLMGEWKAEMERKKRDFREETEAARRMAIRDIRARSAALIVDATEKLIHLHVDESQAQQMMDEAIEDMKKKRPEK